MNSAITDLIPQRPPIVMVDELVGVEEDVTTTRLTVREENIFVDGGIFSECGLIEHMAQSAAARVGYLFRSAGKEIPVGYIGSVNNFALVRLPETGETVETRITVVQEVFNITLVEAVSAVGDEEIASCQMKIFLDTDETES